MAAKKVTPNKLIGVIAIIGLGLLLLFNIIFNLKSSSSHLIIVSSTYDNDIHSNTNNQEELDTSNISKLQNDLNKHTNQLLIDLNQKLNHIKKDNDKCSFLFCNEEEFNIMIKYYKSISSNLYPLTWNELNEQLLCPIKYSHSLNKYSSLISSAGERLLKYIYANQFLSNCSSLNNKYMFYDTSGWYTGLGATTNGGIIKYFSRSLMSNRTFILIGDWDWAKVPHCTELGNDRNGFKCYFLPTSNCKYDDVIKYIDINNPDQYYYGTGLPKDCNVGDFPDKPWCKQNVLYIKQHGAGWYPKNEDIDKWINTIASYNKNSIFANFQQYKAVIIAFVYRLQPNIREIIYNKIKNAFVKSYSQMNVSLSLYDPFRCIGFPIRASDKCKDNKLGMHGEMECWTIDELYKLLYSIHYLNPSLNTLIFTSEDMHYIDQLIDYLDKNVYSDGFKWNIIINHDDTKPSIGSARFRNEKYNKKLTLDNNADKGFEYDVIVGALSSLLLQTSNTKYVVHTKSSSWLDNLWNIASQLSCESIFWSKQMEINGFKHYSNTKTSVIKPDFIHDSNKKYHYFNRYCFELKQQGLLNKKVKWKHVLYPPDLWDKIHELNLDEYRFKRMFGIDIYNNGWNNYCSRFTKPPFVTGDDVGV